MKTITKICRLIAIVCATIAFVVNVWHNNWLGASINIATLIACV